MRHIHRAWRNPALPLLQFAPMAGLEAGHVAVAPGTEVGEAADHKHAFTITHERSEFADPFFVAQVRWLDGSHQRRIGWKFKTFEEAVRLCSIFTREARRQVAYHEAGHAVVAWLLGFSGVWIDMEDNPYRAITRCDLLPAMLAVADSAENGGGRAVLTRHLYGELMFSVAGTVAEETIAGSRVNYVETDVAGRTSIAWDAVRVARLEAGLPICGHKDCEIPMEAGPVDAGPVNAGPVGAGVASAGSGSAGRVTAQRVTGEDVAEVTKRAEDEVFALLKANWPVVQRVVRVLCRRDRITSIEFEDLITGSGNARKRSSNHRGQRQRPKRKPAARQEVADTSTALVSRRS
jgi:hypothetical protein